MLQQCRKINYFKEGSRLEFVLRLETGSRHVLRTKGTSVCDVPLLVKQALHAEIELLFFPAQDGRILSHILSNVFPRVCIFCVHNLMCPHTACFKCAHICEQLTQVIIRLVVPADKVSAYCSFQISALLNVFFIISSLKLPL